MNITAELNLFLPKPALLKLYYALIHSHLLYGLAIWGSTFPSNLNKLASLRNKAVKLVTGGKYQDHGTPFYSQLNVLKLLDLVKHETAKIVHCHLHPLLLPLFIKSSQKFTRVTTAVNSSSSLTLHSPGYSTNQLHRSTMYKGVKIRNNIYFAIKSEVITQKMV